MYIEVSSISGGDKAILTSPYISTGPGKYCLDFWYHMYGTGIGSLNVYLLYGDKRHSIWSLSGNQGNLWLRALVNFTVTDDMVKVRFLTIMIINDVNEGVNGRTI